MSRKHYIKKQLNLNGSSLSIWSNYLKGAEQYKPILGSAREIRSDDWAVWSTFTISQGFSGWPAVSQAIAGGNISTLWISIGGIPAWNLAFLFKPLYWGFLLLGTDRGFSFLFRIGLLCSRQTRLLALRAAQTVFFAKPAAQNADTAAFLPPRSDGGRGFKSI